MKRIWIYLGVGLVLVTIVVAGSIFAYRKYGAGPKTIGPFASVRTRAGVASTFASKPFKEVFGVAVTSDGTVFISDGGTGRISRITSSGSETELATLDTPSALALAPDGSLVVADTGAHAIYRIETKDRHVTLLAGTPGHPGYRDGPHDSALFNAPIGVAVSVDGTIFIADTYNDRVRALLLSGEVITVAGGAGPGYVDGDGQTARFDTPCGVALLPDGALAVADTGNRRVRRVERSGVTTTLAGSGAYGSEDGAALAAGFVEPLAVLAGPDSLLYIADAGAASIRVLRLNPVALVATVAGEGHTGLADGARFSARFNRPTGLAQQLDGALLVADSGNGLLREVTDSAAEHGPTVSSNQILAMRALASEFREMSVPRWPYDPPEQTREIAATLGEIRGEIRGEFTDAHYHNGLDIPGNYGELARAVRTEKCLLPQAVEDVASDRERIRLPEIGYIHIRIGRDSNDLNLDATRFQVLYDNSNRAARVRVRRGTRFLAGDPLGALNHMNHVHLIAGPAGQELNALAALALPGVKDTIAPTIEPDGVQLFNEAWQPWLATAGPAQRSVPHISGVAPVSKLPDPVEVTGKLRIVVSAYDRMDGNADRRKLGVYRLGYELLAEAGTNLPGTTGPVTTISFERLPDDGSAVPLVYAEGSRSGATGPTRFAYIVTNTVKDGTAAEGFLDTDALRPGIYKLRVFAADYFGNETSAFLLMRTGAARQR